MRIIYSFWLISLLIFLGCTEEEKLSFPMVQTGNVVDISATGVVFHGKIMSQGIDLIIDHGFVWDTKPSPSLDDGYIKSLGAYSTVLFSSNISSALIDGETYYVRAYLRDGHQTVYGRAVSFSTDLNLPEIFQFNPQIASWGDTVYISGQHFSSKEGENVVSLGNYRVNTVNESDSLIIITVPQELDSTDVWVNLKYFDFSTSAHDRFALEPPIIHDFDPQSGTYMDTIRVVGQYFHTDFTDVYLNAIKASIINVNESEIALTIPSGLPEGMIDLKVEVAHQVAVADEKFISTAPKINSISPIQGTWNDIVIIEGVNFSNTLEKNTVRFADVEAEIVDVIEQKLKVKVPADLINEYSKISLEVNEQVYEFNDSFVLDHPNINSFEPQLASFRDTLTLEGEFFHPVLSSNKVYFGEAEAIVYEGTISELKVIVPDYYYSVNGRNSIKLEIGDLSAISSNDFELYLHSITDFDPKVDRKDNITITGDYFNPVTTYNEVFLNEFKLTILYSDKNSLIATIPDGVKHGSKNLKITVAGRDVVANQEIMVYEPWSEKEKYPEGSVSHAFSFSIGEYGYIAGGIDNGNNNHYALWQYDPNAGEWNRRADSPISKGNTISFSTNSKGYILNNKELYQYDPDNDVWLQKASFPGIGDKGQTSFAIKNKGYVGTGYRDQGQLITSEFWEYNEENDEWTQINPLSDRGAIDAMSFSLNGKGYVISACCTYKGVHEYDPSTNQWTKKLDKTYIEGVIDGAIRLDWVGFSINNLGYMGTGNGGRRYNDFYQYDPSLNIITKLVELPSSSRVNGIAFSINNRGYVGLGYGLLNNSLQYLDDFWEFDPSKIKR